MRKIKCLDQNSRIVMKTYFHDTTECKYVGITEKLMIYRAYKLQMDTLGYIVHCGLVTFDRSPIMGNVHAQINRMDREKIDSTRANATMLIYRMLQNKSAGTGMHKRLMAALETGECNNRDPHIVIFMRLARKMKRDNMLQYMKKIFTYGS